MKFTKCFLSCLNLRCCINWLCKKNGSHTEGICIIFSVPLPQLWEKFECISAGRAEVINRHHLQARGRVVGLYIMLWIDKSSPWMCTTPTQRTPALGRVLNQASAYILFLIPFLLPQSKDFGFKFPDCRMWELRLREKMQSVFFLSYNHNIDLCEIWN